MFFWNSAQPSEGAQAIFVGGAESSPFCLPRVNAKFKNKTIKKTDEEKKRRGGRRGKRKIIPLVVATTILL